MKSTVLLLPITFEYDPDEKESLQKSFDVTDSELYELMLTIGRRFRQAKEDGNDTLYCQQIFVDMIKNHEVSDTMIMYLVCRGILEAWSMFCDGILLMLDAEKEKNDAT